MAGGNAFGAGGLTSGSINSISADATLPGVSDMVPSSGVLYSAASSFVGTASFSALAIKVLVSASTMAGAGSMSANADLSNAIALLVGSASWFIDPSKLTVIRVPSESQIPTTAKPPTIPVIRPPVPPIATPVLSVSPPGTTGRGKGTGQSRRGL